jgi:hypothetical protein
MKMKKKINGNLIYDKNLDYSDVEEITGYLYCSGTDTKAAFPKLTTIGGYLYCSGTDTKAAFPKLTTIGGYLYCYGSNTNAAFPKLTTIGGYLYCSGTDTKAAFPKLTTIGGNLDCSGTDTKAAFPKLTTIGGYLYCSCTDTKAAFPKLTTIGGYLYCSGTDTKAAFPKLTTIGGNLYCYGSNTKAAFPKLTTIGGYLDCSGTDTKAAFPKLTKQNTGNKKAKKTLFFALKKEGFLFLDGILSFWKGSRESNGLKIHKVVIVGKVSVSYCLEIGEVFSHGETIKEAKESLIYKVGDRDKSDYKDWTIDKKITKKQAIESYRVITGACESGVRNFVEQSGKTKQNYTVKDIVDITKGQYGNKEYMSFFKNK